MVRHPAALLLLSLWRLLSLGRLLSLRRLGRSGAGLNCVLCTAIKTLQCKKQSDGERKIQQYGFGSPGQQPEQNNVNIVCDVAYDVIDSTYDFAYDEYHMTL
jgi:hypothetical protein